MSTLLPARAPVHLRTRSCGFTLIELVIVILIVGILAAAALPRFAGLGKDARTSTAQATYGAVRAATHMAHMAWITAGSTDFFGSSVTLDGGTVLSMYRGYPDGGNCCWLAGGGGIERAIDVNRLDVVYLDNVSTRFEVRGAPTPANCSTTYSETSVLTTPPVITLDISGC